MAKSWPGLVERRNDVGLRAGNRQGSLARKLARSTAGKSTRSIDREEDEKHIIGLSLIAVATVPLTITVVCAGEAESFVLVNCCLRCCDYPKLAPSRGHR